MIELLRKALELVLRFLDWRKATQRDRERNEVRKAVTTHDRKLMNEIIQEGMNKRD